MKKKRILFTIANFNIGGPQKSLLALLHKIDYTKYECDLMILSGEGALLKYLPPAVNVLETPIEIKFALISKKELRKSTFKLLQRKKAKLVFKALNTLNDGYKLNNMGQARQKFWLENHKYFPELNQKYDVAFGVSGGHSMMYINDCVSSNKKIGWIRSDYRVLKRNIKIDNIYFRGMDYILSVSKECKVIFDGMFPEHAHKTVTMYNVLPFDIYKNIKSDISFLEKEHNTINVLTICRLDPNKGIDMAMEAMSKLLEKKINIKWYVLGDGSFKKSIEDEIKKRKLENNFILLGFHLNTMDFIEKCDIVVHPSRFEGKSNVIDEAKYLNKPIIATNYETVGEQIQDNINGIIAEMNGESIANNIEKLINSKELREKLITNLSNEESTEEQSLKTFYRIIEN
ncbi:glycosyltransferase [Planococcus sp. NCCP-2050]|uniref:glycosyltransferase n=1 Tax=Planococcus sp. NCCP-2050 TaxID=2944679 RepID=UPI00204258EF|nr:glycosyltransferase [Planococcus sp. NCCP-2050]GKW45324.1 hypothetical protein NCCP2050_10160 [Planococcus sp. NCCP-2050]